MDFSSFEVCLWTKPESDQLQACMICLKRGQRNTILWIKAYGWMRFHRDTLSVFRWFKPLSHDRDLGCHWQRKFPSVFAAVVCLQLSICHCCDVEKTPPAPHWLCHLLLSPNPQYICTHIHPSIHPCFSHQVWNCLFTFTVRLPPPLSALVATETADSGRVGGCLRALAALPHAALSQYISASVLLLWPWYADSSGGSVRCYTIVSATQSLFVHFPQRTCSEFRLALPFMFSFYSNNGSQEASWLPADKSLVVADFFFNVLFVKFVQTLFVVVKWAAVFLWSSN